MADAYKDDLAYIHDVGFGHLARSAASVLLELLRQEGKVNGRVVDLGCGSGIMAQQLCAAGYDVLGIDISNALLDIARERVPQGEFRTGSFLKVQLPECIAVTAIGECFNYLFDNGNTKQELLKLFRHIYEALCPEGLLVFDVAEPGRVSGSNPLRTYTEGEDWAVLMTAEEDEQHYFLSRRITTFRKVGEFYRRDHEVHQLQLLKRAELTEQLQSISFCVRVLAGYGQLQFVPGHIGLLAQKP